MCCVWCGVVWCGVSVGRSVGRSVVVAVVVVVYGVCCTCVVLCYIYSLKIQKMYKYRE